MKKFKFLSLLLIIAVIASCTREESIVQELNSELKSKITVNKSTNLVSEALINIGIESIAVENKEKITEYKFKSKINEVHKNFIVNGIPVDLFTNSFVLDENYIYIKDEGEIKLTFVDNKPYIISNQFTGYLKDNLELMNNEELITLLITMNEITLDEGNKFDTLHSNRSPNPPFIERPCSFWNTYYSVGIGLNSSAAWANYHYNNQNDTNSGDLIGCEPIGDPEHTSLGVVHYVTRAYCCN